MQKVTLQILEFFKDLSFNEKQHLYTVPGITLSTSVSSLIKKFVVEVDFTIIAAKIDKRDNLKLGTTAQAWETKKDKSCKKGSKVHLFGEVYPFNKHLKPRNKYEEAVVKFWNGIPPHIVPVIMELKMWHKEYLFPGTADIILYDTINKTFIIADYKTNEDLFKNFNNKKLKRPFNKLLDSPFSKYELQLSFYQILFEQTGYKVSGRKLIWLKDTGEYEMYNTKDYTEVLINHLKNNKI